MKKCVGTIAMLLVSMICFSSTSFAEKGSIGDIELFGLNLKDASRASLRDAILKSGFSLHPTDPPTEWEDFYAVNGQFFDAYLLSTSFDPDTDKFASAMYIFPDAVGQDRFDDVVDLLSKKYGETDIRESAKTPGTTGAIWKDSSGDWRIAVVYSKRDKTLYLSYMNWPVHTKYRAWVGERKAKEGPAPSVF